MLLTVEKEPTSMPYILIKTCFKFIMKQLEIKVNLIRKKPRSKIWIISGNMDLLVNVNVNEKSLLL